MPKVKSYISFLGTWNTKCRHNYRNTALKNDTSCQVRQVLSYFYKNFILDKNPREIFTSTLSIRGRGGGLKGDLTTQTCKNTHTIRPRPAFYPVIPGDKDIQSDQDTFFVPIQAIFRQPIRTYLRGSQRMMGFSLSQRKYLKRYYPLG